MTEWQLCRTNSPYVNTCNELETVSQVTLSLWLLNMTNKGNIACKSYPSLNKYIFLSRQKKSFLSNQNCRIHPTHLLQFKVHIHSDATEAIQRVSINLNIKTL